MERILPMMIMPFMISTGMIPMMLMSLKFMMLKSALIGKIAIILMLINMFRNRSNRGGVFTHNIMGEEPRKRGNNQDDFLKLITPMLATPFIMQTTFLPFALIAMKLFLGMSMFLGKLGIIIWIFNILHNRMDTSGHLYSHNINIH
nr:unnamed protein product [Callosobruchus analis]